MRVSRHENFSHPKNAHSLYWPSIAVSRGDFYRNWNRRGRGLASLAGAKNDSQNTPRPLKPIPARRIKSQSLYFGKGHFCEITGMALILDYFCAFWSWLWMRVRLTLSFDLRINFLT